MKLLLQVVTGKRACPKRVKAVCRQLLVPARQTVRNAEWLTTNAAVIGLLEGSGGSSADGPEMVGDASNFVEFTAPFTPAPVVEPTPAMRAVEKRKCTACGQHLSSDAFSGKQWPKEQRRCKQCLGNVGHRPQPRPPAFLPLCVMRLSRTIRWNLGNVRPRAATDTTHYSTGQEAR